MELENNAGNDDQTILDSRFGIGDAETTFAEMGLPEGRPKRSPVRWIGLVLLIAGGIVVMQQMSQNDANDAERIRAQRRLAETQLRDGLAGGSTEDCRVALQQLGPKHNFQSLVTWLDAMDRADSASATMNWESALAILQQVPTVPDELKASCGTFVTNSIRVASSSLRQRRLWKEVDQTQLDQVTAWLKQAPHDATDLDEAARIAKSLKTEKRSAWEREYQHHLAAEDWSAVEDLLGSLPPNTDLVPLSSWFESLNLRRRESELLSECRNHLLAGHFLTANRLLPTPAPTGPYHAGFDTLRKGLVDLGEEAAELKRAVDFFRDAEFAEGFKVLDSFPQDNAVILFIREHWQDIFKRHDEFRRAVDESVAEKVAQLERGRLLLQRIPVDGGALRDALVVQTGVLTTDLDAHANHLEMRLGRAWESSDFRGAWDKATQLLAIRPGDKRALQTQRRLNSVAESLVDEIYILRNRDRELAHKRFDELKQIVPPGHPEHAAARDLLAEK